MLPGAWGRWLGGSCCSLRYVSSPGPVRQAHLPVLPCWLRLVSAPHSARSHPAIVWLRALLQRVTHNTQHMRVGNIQKLQRRLCLLCDTEICLATDRASGVEGPAHGNPSFLDHLDPTHASLPSRCPTNSPLVILNCRPSSPRRWVNL